MQNSEEFKYSIAFSRRRTLSIVISPDKGIIVKAPLRTPFNTIHRFVDSKSAWIRKTIQGFNHLKRIDNSLGYSDGEKILFRGKQYLLRLNRNESSSVSLSKDDTIEVNCRNDLVPEAIRLLLDKWFWSVARGEITVKFNDIVNKLNHYNFKPSGFAVRKMKSRWGSCSSRGKIAVSYDLIRLEDSFTEYVIIHELCHLRHHNHGTDYYTLLTEIYPDWKRKRADLKKYIR